jgi:uncharacterized protein YjbJ (UPF0337 family)
VGDKTDDFKGRAKEAVGAVAGDEDLKREGKADQAAATVKEHIEDAKDKLGKVVDKAKDWFSGGRDK